MSFNAAALRLMQDKGLSLADVIEIATANESRSSAALRQARYRDNKRQRYVTRDVTPPPIEDTSYPLSSETQVSSEGESERGRENPFPRPDWADRQHWRDFMANRKRRRMTNSPTAYAQFLGDVAKLADDEWPPGKLLELAAGKGWGSINLPEEYRNGRRTGQANGTRGIGSDPLLDAHRRAVEEERAADDQAAVARSGASLSAVFAGRA